MKKKQKGQILIILLMLTSTIIAIVFSLTFKSKIETEMTKLEEENQKTLAAAQAGIEAVLKQKTTVKIGSDILPNSGIEGTAQIENLNNNTFTTPFLKKDEQYTFYLTQYNSQSKSFTGESTAQDVNVCFGSSSFNPAVEITLIKENSIKRYAVNPVSSTIISNGRTASSVNPEDQDCPSDYSFVNKFTISSSDIGNNSQLLTIRLIALSNGQTKVGFKASSPFPSQGDTITSEVKSIAGVVKKIQLFQSYPQIPTEFFVTQF